MKYKNISLKLMTVTACLLSTQALAATNYPDRPVTLVIGFTAGGPTDIVGRYLAKGLEQELGQTVVVENKPGATGVVALQSVKKAKPDGYTLMLGSSSTLSIEPVYKKNVTYDVQKELVPIGLVASYPYLLVVPESSPYKSVNELIKGARDNPGKLTFASAGNGAVNHLAGEWFKFETKTDLNHIPYKGDSAAITDLSAGRVNMAFLSIIASNPLLESGKMRALAIASEEKSPLKPELNSVAEEIGVQGFSAEPWNGVLGPAGIPDEIVTKLNKAITKVMSTEDARLKLFELGQIPFTGSAQDFNNHIQSQMTRWDNVINTANIERVE